MSARPHTGRADKTTSKRPTTGSSPGTSRPRCPGSSTWDRRSRRALAREIWRPRYSAFHRIRGSTRSSRRRKCSSESSGMRGRSSSASRDPERLRAHIQLGRIANRLAAYQDARTILAEAVREAAALAVPEVEGEALRALGGVERKLGDLPAAMGHLERAADLLPHGSRERVRTLTDLGAVLIARGDHARAKARLLEAAASVRSGTRDDAAIQINLGIVSSREGDTRTAAETFARSAEIALGSGDVRFASYALANAVDNFLRLGAVEAAASSAERAVRLAETIGDPVALSTAKANLGLVFAKRGDWT